jgi:hypothetical protein
MRFVTDYIGFNVALRITSYRKPMVTARPAIAGRAIDGLEIDTT